MLIAPIVCLFSVATFTANAATHSKGPVAKPPGSTSTGPFQPVTAKWDEATPYEEPHAILLEPGNQGTLLAVDTGNGKLTRIVPQGGSQFTRQDLFTLKCRKDKRPLDPRGMTFDNEGNLYLTVPGAHEVIRFKRDRTGYRRDPKFAVRWAKKPLLKDCIPADGATDAFTPVDVAISKNGEIIVADGPNGRAFVFDDTGACKRIIENPLRGPQHNAGNAPPYVSGVTTTPEGEVFFVSHSPAGGAMGIYSVGNDPKAAAQPVTLDPPPESPYKITFGKKGELYVAQYYFKEAVGNVAVKPHEILQYEKNENGKYVLKAKIASTAGARQAVEVGNMLYVASQDPSNFIQIYRRGEGK